MFKLKQEQNVKCVRRMRNNKFVFRSFEEPKLDFHASHDEMGCLCIYTPFMCDGELRCMKLAPSTLFCLTSLLGNFGTSELCVMFNRNLFILIYQSHRNQVKSAVWLLHA